MDGWMKMSPSFWSFMVYKNYETNKLKYITNDTGFLIRKINKIVYNLKGCEAKTILIGLEISLCCSCNKD